MIIKNICHLFSKYRSVFQLEAMLQRIIKGKLTFVPHCHNKFDCSISIFDTLQQAHYIYSMKPIVTQKLCQELFGKHRDDLLLPSKSTKQEITKKKEISNHLQDYVNLKDAQKKKVVVEEIKKKIQEIEQKLLRINQIKEIDNLKQFRGYGLVVNLHQKESEIILNACIGFNVVVVLFQNSQIIYRNLPLLKQNKIKFNILPGPFPFFLPIPASGFPTDNFIFNYRFYQLNTKAQKDQLNKFRVSKCTAFLIQKKLIENVYGQSQLVSLQEISYTSQFQKHKGQISNIKKELQNNSLQNQLVAIVISPYNYQFNYQLMKHKKEYDSMLYDIRFKSTFRMAQRDLERQQMWIRNKKKRRHLVSLRRVAQILVRRLDGQDRELNLILSQVCRISLSKAQNLINTAKQNYIQDYLNVNI